MKKYFYLLLILFGEILFSQEIIFPDSFDVDSTLLKGYSLPEDDSFPNPQLVEEINDSIFSIKKLYVMYFFKDYEKLKESNQVTGNENMLMIVVSVYDSEEEIRNYLKENLIRRNDENAVLLGIDKYTILIGWTESNKKDAGILVNYYQQKLGAKILID